MATVSSGAARPRARPALRVSPKIGLALREIVLLGSLMVFYDAGRLLGAQRSAGAYASGAGIWQLERTLSLPDEQSLQALLLPFHHLIEAANLYYKYVHFPLTVAVLGWLFATAPQHYRWARRAIIAASAAALVIYVAYPVAPPRMLNGSGTLRLGMVDTGVAYHQSVYGVPGARSISNQFASMPSLHVGWALLIACVMIHASRTRFRWLWLAHPVITLAVVVVTANHYWLDAFAGAGLVGVALLACRPATLPLDRSAEAQASAPSGLAAILNRTICPGRS